MRRLFACLAAAILLIGTTGCQTEQVQADERINIVCTVFPQYDFARIIGGEYADVSLLLSAGQEMHNYEPTPMDVAEIASCDIFLRIGGESEVWTDTLLDALDTSDMQVVTLIDAVENPLEHDHEESGCTEEHDHESDEKHAHNDETCTLPHNHEELHFDEHIWNSPINAIAMAEAVCASLCQAAPEHEAEFRQRTEEYTAELVLLDTQYRQLAESCEEPILVVADKFPFRYLAAEYGFEYTAAFSGCSSETEPTVASLSDLIETTKHHGIETVFYLEFSSPKIANRLQEITGAVPVQLRPGHNISAEDMESGVTFLELMQKNYEVIKEALT